MNRLLSAVLVVLLAGPVLARSSRPPVVDRAKLFSPEAVERANLLLADIREKSEIDLWVDTFTELPGEDAAKIKALKSTDAKRAFLRQWALARAEAEGGDGFYVVVTTDPRLITLVGVPSSREEESLSLKEGGGLIWHKREYILRRRFDAELRAKSQSDHDHALLTLVAHFRQEVAARAAVGPSPLSTLQAGMVVGGLVGLWVVLSLLRRMVASRDGGPPRPIYQPAMLGSLFGVPAGFWIYDQLFHLERARKPPAVEDPAKTPPASEDGILPPGAAPETPEETAPLIEERS